jgi:DNA-binding XRE family transcriptional regulator
MSGFVYLVVSESGFYKIGFTKNDPRRRVAMLRTGNAEELALVGAVCGTMGDEKALHALLAPWRVSREWFAPCKGIDYLADIVTPIEAGRAVNHPLAAARRALGITQADLAAATGLNRVSIARIESRSQHPPLRTIARLLDAVRALGGDMSVNDFLPKADAA